jgi:hypothetical protein
VHDVSSALEGVGLDPRGCMITGNENRKIIIDVYFILFSKRIYI